MSKFEEVKKMIVSMLIENITEESFVQIVLPIVRELGVQCREDIEIIVAHSAIPDQVKKQIDCGKVYDFLKVYL